MDSIIRQAVREELRRSSSSRPETASSTNQDDQGRSENESDAAGSHEVRFHHEQWAVWVVFKTMTQEPGEGGPVPCKGLIGTCGQPGYFFGIFVSNRVSILSFFDVIRVSILSIFVLNRVSFRGQ